MKIVDPITVSDSNLTTTNVAETVPLYDVGATYALGDTVRDDTTHHLFEALTAGESGNALTDAAKWLDLGSTNPWKMFDQYLESQTENASAIIVTITDTTIVNAVALFNLSASSVRVQVDDATEGEVYDETYSLISDENCADAWEYCFNPIIRETAKLIDDLPPYSGAAITVTIADDGATAKCGALVMGQVRELGATVYGADFGIIDHSLKTTDDFGRTTITPRSFRKTGNFRVIVGKNYVNEIDRLLSERRAVFTVFSGTGEYSATLIYGFPRDWRVTLEHPLESALTIEIEGVA